MSDTIVEMQTKLDAYKGARDIRLEQQRAVDTLKEQEQALQYELITYLQDNPEINGLMGSTHKALLKDGEVPIINDLAKFQQYIIDTGEWDLAQNLRPSAPAIRDRLEDNVEVPGVEMITETKLSITKI